jgi:hypothetical protein
MIDPFSCCLLSVDLHSVFDWTVHYWACAALIIHTCTCSHAWFMDGNTTWENARSTKRK